MRVTKTIVVTTGAIALAAVGGTPAFAAVSMPEIAAANPATHVLKQGKHHASNATVARGGWQEYHSDMGGPNWGAPWESNPAPIVGVLNGSVTNVAPWQICGSTTVAGVGGAVPLNSPNTVLGDCNNANTILVSR